MNIRRDIKDSERGSALLIVLVLMSALAAVAGGMSLMATTEQRLSSNDVQEKETFYLVEAAVEEVIQELNVLGEPFLGDGNNRDQPVLVLENEPRLGMGAVSVYVDPMDTNGGQATRFLQISATARHKNGRVSKALSVRVGQQNFSRYAYFSDVEVQPSGTKIWFFTRDELFGPVHSNDQFHISGDPTFHAEVTSAASSVDYANGGPPSDEPDFRQGLTLDVEPIDLPQDLAIIKAKAQQPEGIYITGATSTSITMVYNAGLGKSELQIRKDSGATQTYALPTNGTVYVDGKVRVKGVLAGQLTIASRDNMYIDDDLVYYTDPRVDPASTDVLGLISEKNVYMATTTANMDSGDETVMAAVMALGESFGAENYSSGPPRGKLKLYGGIIQKRRGAVGTFSGDTTTAGYEKSYDHDARLMDTPPPSFPTTGVMERLSWQEIDPATDISENLF